MPFGSTTAWTRDPDPGAVERSRLARFLRHQSREAVPSELMDLEPLSARLDDLARAPDRWDTLSEAWISLLAFHQMLGYAYTEDPVRLVVLRTLYLYATKTLGMRSRMALENDVAQNLESAASSILALEPFTLVDPDPAVVATAAMDIATLAPLEEGDELTGPRSVARQAKQLFDVDETRAAAMIAGLLLLGDARILPLVNLTWRKLGQAGKSILREQQSGVVCAATVEYFLQWIGLAEEDDFGHPAGALGRLAEGMTRAPGVRDVRRRFPAPFNQSDEEFRANPPFHVLQEWTKEDFARAIEPQLRMAYMRETYDKVMPRVLRAWGLEVGEDESEDQIRRTLQAWTWAASQLAQLDREDDGSEAFPWEQHARSTVARLFRDHPVEPALWQAYEEVTRLEQEAETRRQRAREHLGSSMYGQLMQAAQHFHLEAEAVMRYVQHRFGLDPRAALMTLQAMRKIAGNASNAAMREDTTQQGQAPPWQLGPQEYGVLLAAVLETLNAATNERDQAIHVMTHPSSLQEVVSAARIAAAAPKKVDDSLGAFTAALPPDDYDSIQFAFLLAIKELLAQWGAELAAYGANIDRNDREAGLQAGEAQRARASFSRWWEAFQQAFDAMERDRPELTRALQLGASARAVIDKDDWLRPPNS